MTATESNELVRVQEQIETLTKGHDEMSKDIKAIRTTLDELAGDYLEMYGFADVVSSTINFSGAIGASRMSGYLVSAS